MTLTVYCDSKGEWRWRLQSGNRRIVADSGEGYTRKSGAVRAAVQMQKRMTGVTLRVPA